MSSTINHLNEQTVQTADASSYLSSSIAVNKLYLSQLLDADHEGILITSMEEECRRETIEPLKLKHPGNFGYLQLNYKSTQWPLKSGSNTKVMSELLLKRSIAKNNEFNSDYIKNDVRYGDWDIIHIMTEKESDCDYLFKKAIEDKYTVILAIRLEIFDINNASQQLTLYSHGDDGPLLHRAVAEKDMKIIKTLIDYKLDINVINDAGWTPLHVAVNARLADVVKLLLEKGANYQLTDFRDRTPLHMAIQKRNLNIIDVFLKNNVDVDILNSQRQTPLFYLIENSIHFQSKSIYKETYSKIIGAFLQNGANINFQDSEGHTLLHYAVINDNIEFVQVLLECKADMEIQDKLGRNILHLACWYKANKCIQTLLNLGININVTDVKKRTTLYMAVKANYYNAVELILKMNPNINMSDSLGKTALHLAIELRLLPIIKLLLENNADVNLKDAFGRTSLQLTIYLNSLPIIELLLKNKADVNYKNENKRTALHLTIRFRCLPIIELILKNNTDVNLRDEFGKTALHLAIESECLPIIQLLLNKNVDVNLKDVSGKTALHLASENPSITINIVKSILNSTRDINAKDSFGKTAIHYAILNYNDCTLKCLLEANADVNVKDFEGKTPLHLTMDPRNSHEPCFECIKVLLDYKADINAVDNNLMSPLHLACFIKNAEIVKYLIENGADSRISDKDGRTVFHYVCMDQLSGISLFINDTNKDIENTLNVLVEENISVNCTDKFGQTPLHYAAKNKLDFTNELLLNIGADINIMDMNHKLAFDEFIDYEQSSLFFLITWQFELLNKIYKQHIVKMKVMKLWVREKILDKIYKKDDSDDLNWIQCYERACNEEIHSMKSTNLEKCNITYYDFFKKSPHNSVNFARNPNIIKSIQSDKLADKFPLYCYFLKCNLRKVQQRSSLYEQIQESLESYIFEKLPTPCMNEILKHLNNSELAIVLEAMKSIDLPK